MGNTINNLKKILYIFVSLCVGLVVFSYAEAATYYVATNGNNNNSGTSAQPWETIQNAADIMGPGDTCIVLPGNYYSAKINITKFGSASAPIIFKAQGAGVNTYGFIISGKYITVDGFEITVPLVAAWNNEDSGAGIVLNNAQYCEIKNNHITHTLRMGIETRGTAKYNKISHNVIAYAGYYSGIYIAGTNNTIEYNDISHTLQQPLKSQGILNPYSSGVDADGIKVEGSGHVIRGNYIHDITWHDPENNNGSNGPHIDGIQACCATVSNVLIDRNYISFKDPGPSINSDVYTQGIYFDDATFSNIVSTNNIIESMQPINYVNVQGGAILNNTLIPSIPTWHTENGIQLVNSSDIKVKNNIIYAGINDPNHKYLYLQSSSTLDIGYNNYFRIGGATDGAHTGDKNLDPNFAVYAAGDFRLQDLSSMRNAGISLSEITADFDGHARPQEGVYDIGAHEYTIVPGPGNNVPSAQNQSVTLAEDTPEAITLNATDLDGDTLTYSVTGQPGNGSLSGTAPNITYAPVANYNGSDLFNFKVNDGQADSVVATVSITITAVNDAPDVPSGLAATVGGTDRITLNWNAASDPDNGDTVKYNLYRGTTAIASNLAVVSYLDTGLLASTSYSYQVEAIDASGAKSAKSSAVSATTQAKPNALPVANNQSVTVNEDIARTIALVATDADGDALTFSIASNPSHGSLSGSGASRTYTPAANYNGSDSFTFKANDGKGDSNPATVSISVSAVNDLPVISSLIATPSSGAAPLSVNFNASASDIDGSIASYTWNFGDSVTGSGSAISHVYAAAGSYSAVLTVTDNTGANVSISITITATAPQSDIPVPDAPVRLRASRISSNTIKVSWTDHSNYEDGFKLQRKKGKSGTFTTIAEVSPAPNELTRVSYEDSGLTKGTYYYRVRAYNSIGQSAFSNTYSAQIL